MNIDAENSNSRRRLQHDNSDMSHLMANDKTEKTVNFALIRGHKISSTNISNLPLGSKRLNS
jgi:hypothetical protein